MKTHAPTRRHPAWPALLVLAIGALSSAFTTWELWRNVLDKDRERFENQVEHTRDSIEGRLDTQEGPQPRHAI